MAASVPEFNSDRVTELSDADYFNNDNNSNRAVSGSDQHQHQLPANKRQRQEDATLASSDTNNRSEHIVPELQQSYFGSLLKSQDVSLT